MVTNEKLNDRYECLDELAEDSVVIVKDTMVFSGVV